jgi:hypothetical protein
MNGREEHEDDSRPSFVYTDTAHLNLPKLTADMISKL